MPVQPIARRDLELIAERVAPAFEDIRGAACIHHGRDGILRALAP